MVIIICMVLTLLGFLIFAVLRSVDQDTKKADQIKSRSSRVEHPEREVNTQKQVKRTLESTVRSASKARGFKPTYSVLKARGVELDLERGDGFWSQDDFLVGYVAGFLDAYLQSIRIELNSDLSIDVHAATFVGLFGHDGVTIFARLVAEEGSHSYELEDGRLIGGKDFMNFIAKKGIPLEGLGDYKFPELKGT